VAAGVSLKPGTRIGVYEVLAPIGAGGMGQVYRARDTRLQRDVAVKILPASFLSDPERLGRFEREARVLASLNHPNIAAIYGVEDARDATSAPMPALILELVEGETLQDRIDRGPLPIGDAVAIASRIADALEAAHDKGIVHRDLKPANIKVTPDGGVKVLDFGLAKALTTDAAGERDDDPSRSPTFTAHGTALGVIMGTAAYMAPEQARGRAVDRRADIWAFGAVFYEMLTGTRPFPGQTISDTLASILKTDPDWTKLPPRLPPLVRALIERCLVRDVRQRLQAIGEARIVLEHPDDGAAVPGTARRSPPWLLPAGVALGIGLGVALGRWTASSAAPVAPRRVDLALEDAVIDLDAMPAISPDGRRIVYSASGKLWVRSLDQFAPKEIPGSSSGTYPFWSPDGKSVGFIRNGKLWRTGIDAAEATALGSVPTDLVGSGGGTWTVDGELILVGSDTVGLYAVPERGGQGREILPLDKQHESDFHEIDALPDRRGLLFTVHRLEGADTIAVFSGGTRHDVLRLAGENLRSPRYSAEGYLLFTRETTSPGIYAVRFSPSTLKTEGEPFLVAPGATSPSVANDGTLAFVRPSEQPAQLVTVDRQGSQSPFADLPARLPRTPGWPMMAISRDRQRLALAIEANDGDEIWGFDLVRRSLGRLTVGARLTMSPVWAPDGRVLFAGFVGNRVWNVHAVPGNETRAPERVLPPADQSQWPCSVSPDGKWLVYAQSMGSGTDLWVAPLDGSSAGQPLARTPFRESNASFSPDGKFIAYTSDESGRPELYVRSYPFTDDRIQVSGGGAAMPVWSADGREIFYRAGTGLMAAALSQPGSRLDAGAPRRLFTPDRQLSQSFVVMTDGRFLFGRSTGIDHVSLVLGERIGK
jgi:eukaryotic-like serine/threonine-protein kinase